MFHGVKIVFVSENVFPNSNLRVCLLNALLAIYGSDKTIVPIKTGQVHGKLYLELQNLKVMYSIVRSILSFPVTACYLAS